MFLSRGGRDLGVAFQTHLRSQAWYIGEAKNSALLSSPNGYLIESFKSTLDEVREADLLVHVVDISHPDFEEQIQVVDKTLSDLGCADKPSMIIFNKTDAYTFVPKDEDDLTPATRENTPLPDLMKTWMARLNGDCLFISARERTNIDELRKTLYARVRELHVQKYPYNDFLFQHYDEE